MYEVSTCKTIPTDGGAIRHIIRETDTTFSRFGEAYFSEVRQGYTKGWKQHTTMILNIVVPVGKIKFHFYDHEQTVYDSCVLSEEVTSRLTVAPGIWMAFSGLDCKNFLLNIASQVHDPIEQNTLPLSALNFNL